MPLSEHPPRNQYLNAALARYRGILIESDREEFDYDEYLRGGAALYGTPDQVAEKIAEIREVTGLNNLLCFMGPRALDPAKARRSMELFAAEVMPRFAAPSPAAAGG